MVAVLLLKGVDGKPQHSLLPRTTGCSSGLLCWQVIWKDKCINTRKQFKRNTKRKIWYSGSERLQHTFDQLEADVGRGPPQTKQTETPAGVKQTGRMMEVPHRQAHNHQKKGILQSLMKMEGMRVEQERQRSCRIKTSGNQTGRKTTRALNAQHKNPTSWTTTRRFLVGVAFAALNNLTYELAWSNLITNYRFVPLTSFALTARSLGFDL